MVDCYSALIELEYPDFVDHAIGKIDSFADQHSAIARAHAETACFILTLPAGNLDHATRCARDLLRVTGYSPVTFEVMNTNELDARLQS